MQLFNSSLYVRTLLELCGEYNPNASSENEAYTLTVDSTKVPVLLYSTQKAVYPEIRVSPFFDETDQYIGKYNFYTRGVEENNEDPNLNYKRKAIHGHIRILHPLIFIYAKNWPQVIHIRDALLQRIALLNYAEAIYYQPTEDWEILDNVYINARYKGNMRIFTILEDGERLVKSDNPAEETGTWKVTDDYLIVNPYHSIENIEIGEIYNGGLAFHDGTLLKQRNILNLTIRQSRKDNPDNPKLEGWRIELLLKYLDTLEMPYYYHAEGVNVNGR